MITSAFRKVFGTRNDRELKKLWPVVDEINQHFESYQSLSESELVGKTDEFRHRLEEGETLDDLLPEAFAVVKETCRRMVGKSWMVTGKEVTWDMVPFDVQLIGGIALHQGKIAEMATGEGKTLVATMPLYLNALEGKGAHLVTVNDYLAQRDAEWMGEIFRYLGLTVGVILSEMDPTQRREAYTADITYGTNNEFGFDYLRDNMTGRPEHIVQVREHHYAIVDEVDSVLIDEARTPLIISGPVEHATHNYDEVKPLVEQLVRVQTRYVNNLIAEGEKALAAENYDEAGLKLLIAQRGAPQNRRLAKLYQKEGVKKLVFDVESAFIRDKRMHEVDEELYYVIDEKRNQIDLTDKGRHELAPNNPDEFVLPDLAEEHSRIEGDESLSPEERAEQKNAFQVDYARKNEKLHNIHQLLKAYSLFEKEKDYVVVEGKVLIVDEFTGRIMYGRRYSDGLHQALEAKENVKIEGETQTLATITLQNYFRLYDKLAGMTGTAETEAQEFWDIYKLDVMVIPTNKPIRRYDMDDLIYRTKREKYNAVIEELEHLYKIGRPVLVGSVSVEESETLSRMLKRRKIPHSVLNAKYHKQESEIVAKAGQVGAVTIATNMAGRGTDIKLGEGVRGPQGEGTDENGIPYGLQIVGTSRHEARRIDRQLRGRAGRQGDPGYSRFYLSLEDDLMRLFGSDRLIKVMDRLGAEEGEVITHKMVTRAIEKAQKRVEEQNFSIRKHLLEYDDVMNKQREVIYGQRRKALKGEFSREDLRKLVEDFIIAQLEVFAGERSSFQDWDVDGLEDILLRTLMIDIKSHQEELNTMVRDEVIQFLVDRALELYDYRREQLPEEIREHIRNFETWMMLRVIDDHWKDHLHQMDMLKEGIGLRAYGQKDPLIEYKRESYEMFIELVDTINQQILERLWRLEVREEQPERRGMPSRLVFQHADATNMGMRGQQPQGQTAIQQAAEKRSEKPRPIVNEMPRVGRNDPCPCGSGKKYKKCHGAGETVRP